MRLLVKIVDCQAMDRIEDFVHPAAKARSPQVPDTRPTGIRVLTGAGVGAAVLVASAALVVVLGLAVAVSRMMGVSTSNPHGPPPNVGADVHAVVAIGSAMLVGGHDRAARSADRGLSWEVVSGLEGVDVMAWALTGDEVLAGGHAGLYRSADGGLSFTRAEGPVAGLDIHALGAQGATIVAASPVSGLMRSTDKGATWRPINASDGKSLVGPIAIDSANPASLVAVDMRRGVVLSANGGASWRAMGGPQAMAVAVDPRDPRRLLVASSSGGALSTDGGASWKAVALPAATSAVTFDGSGTWVATALVGSRASTYTSSDSGVSWHATNG